MFRGGQYGLDSSSSQKSQEESIAPKRLTVLMLNIVQIFGKLVLGPLDRFVGADLCRVQAQNSLLSASEGLRLSVLSP